MKRNENEHGDDLMQIYNRINQTLDRLFRNASPLDADGKPKRHRTGADEALDTINKTWEGNR